MASDTMHTVQILLSDLPTKSVTFAPQRATVVREIQDVEIKPGPNEVTIYGLDQDVDLDSIRVEGHGPATITDIQTEIVPHKDRFEDVYPEESEDETSGAEQSDDDYGIDKSELEEARKDVKNLDAKLETARNEHATAITSLGFLDNYGKSMGAKEVEVTKMEDFLTLYLTQRAKLGDTHQEASATIADLSEQIQKTKRRIRRLEGVFAKATSAASKEGRRARKKRQKEKGSKREEKQRARDELRKFWPWSVSQVVLHLDGSGFTPNSSRRNSIASGKTPEAVKVEQTEKSGTVTLLLKYVGHRATWSPRYEFSLNTPSSSGKIVYRAEFQNYSSETWRDAKVTLSTSQTSFSGLDEKIPSLQAWHVKLGKEDENLFGEKKNANWSGGLENRIEINARMSNSQGFGNKKAANNNFMYNGKNQSAFGGFGKPAGVQPQQDIQQATAPTSNIFAQQQQQSQGFGSSNIAQSSSLFGGLSSNTALSGRGLFGSSSNTAPVASSLFGGGASSGPSADESIEETRYRREMENAAAMPLPDEEEPDIDNDTLAPSNILAYQESSHQEYGLTTAYDLPGHRTLRPSSLKRRHVIAELNLKDISLSHVLIPKLRPAAFLRVKVKNTSAITLLRGKAGLTLDGTFLGNVVLPSCSPDNTFNLSLGVDPSIHVMYAKPTVRRATSGFFNKEDCAVFTRVCWIKNTKSSPISILVLDQVPVSEDERLRVHILEPKGLDKDGDKVKLEGSKEKWGKGLVTMGKGGELKWDLTLERGKDLKLVLEYEARIPSGQKIIGIESL